MPALRETADNHNMRLLSLLLCALLAHAAAFTAQSGAFAPQRSPAAAAVAMRVARLRTNDMVKVISGDSKVCRRRRRELQPPSCHGRSDAGRTTVRVASWAQSSPLPTTSAPSIHVPRAPRCRSRCEAAAALLLRFLV